MNQKKFYTSMKFLFLPQLQILYYLIMYHLLKILKSIKILNDHQTIRFGNNDNKYMVLT